jgi:heterodisulfide reductase subunit B
MEDKMEQTFADAVLKVFTCALVDAHNAARKEDKEARAKFSAVAEALEAAYPNEVKLAYDMAECGGYGQ